MNAADAAAAGIEDGAPMKIITPKGQVTVRAHVTKIVRKGDVIIAKNYLQSDEIESLNRLVDIFRTSAEERVKDRRDLTLDFWRKNVDNLLSFQNKDILQGKGSITNEEAESIVRQVYDDFNAKRKQLDAQTADADDLRLLDELAKKIYDKK